ncbi:MULTISPECIES: hypothetical protein [Streptomyces]|uniref:hypothetical protein n=1 Tax=Streptomyces TaxID=1883 RepID=UPI0004CCF6DE|nr:hypothetical protein [Streptomyces durhamensis]
MTVKAYNDDALVIARSAQVPVHGRLRKSYAELSGKWFGSLTPSNLRTDLYPLLESGDQLTLRLPDGREGTFAADWTSVNGVTGSIRIVGTGPPPF